MKEFKVEMTLEVSKLANEAIRTKNDIIKFLLEAISLLTYGEIVDRPTGDYIILRIDKMKRLFFIQENKISSFNFPFNIEKQSEMEKPSIYDPLTELELGGKNLAVLKAIFYELLDTDEDKTLMDLDSDLYRIMESFEMKPEKDKLWEILKSLITFEPGYLRLDHDKKREKGKIHPLNHLDINYSSEGTYKIGLSSKLESDAMIDVLDINTDCYFLSK